MAGYDGYSMSNNARAARQHGRVPASVLAKQIGRGATAAGVAKVLTPCEWHHTSAKYNRTNFYDLDSAAENLAEEREISEHDARAEIEAKIIAASKTNTVETIHTGCTVRWLEWGGTRNHPKATERRAENCTVVDGGKPMLTVIFEDGTTMKKGRDTRGFCAGNAAGTIWVFNG